MADLDELQINLSNYKTQLQQVEATLLSDPDNEDLLKLKGDLTEVLELTQDLISQKVSADGRAPPGAGFGSDDDSAGHRAASAWLAWSVGDECMAPWAGDKKYYEATIDEIMEGDVCIVTYALDESTAVTKLSLLKARNTDGEKMDESQPSSSGKMNKKDRDAAQRDYKRKKQQKKKQRWQQMEEERETEKNKWLNFNTKIAKTMKLSKPKKSIFATPEGDKGRVGVGTCNVSGKPMTSYAKAEKWRK